MLYLLNANYIFITVKNWYYSFHTMLIIYTGNLKPVVTQHVRYICYLYLFWMLGTNLLINFSSFDILPNYSTETVLHNLLYGTDTWYWLLWLFCRLILFESLFDDASNICLVLIIFVLVGEREVRFEVIWRIILWLGIGTVFSDTALPRAHIIDTAYYVFWVDIHWS